MPNAGQQIEVTIERIGTTGDGVGTWQNLHVIVPKTAPGDKINCIVKYTTQNRIHASLVSIIQAGAARTAPPCEYYTNCGGCSLQHITGTEYKNYKLQLLTDALEHAQIAAPANIDWVSTGDKSRRRAFIRFDTRNNRMGFYEQQSHNVVDIENCMILDPVIEMLLAPLKKLSTQLGSELPLLEGWMITNTDTGIDLVLHSGNKKTRNEARILEILSRFALDNKIARLAWKCGKQNIPVITLSKPLLLIEGREVILPEEYFLQASRKGQDAILSAVNPHIADGAKVLDLFSGVGIYSFALADKASRVSAYEISPEMVDSMEINIRTNKLSDKISAYCHDIEKYPLEFREISKYDTAIINPPRTGALSQVTTLASAKIQMVIMVSCNSNSFTRDAKILCDNGYKLQQLTAIDQFYYSHHLEQVGVFVLG